MAKYRNTEKGREVMPLLETDDKSRPLARFVGLFESGGQTLTTVIEFVRDILDNFEYERQAWVIREILADYEFIIENANNLVRLAVKEGLIERICEKCKRYDPDLCTHVNLRQ